MFQKKTKNKYFNSSNNSTPKFNKFLKKNGQEY